LGKELSAKDAEIQQNAATMQHQTTEIKGLNDEIKIKNQEIERQSIQIAEQQITINELEAKLPSRELMQVQENDYIINFNLLFFSLMRRAQTIGRASRQYGVKLLTYH